MLGLPHFLSQQKNPVCLSLCAVGSLGHWLLEADVGRLLLSGRVYIVVAKKGSCVSPICWAGCARQDCKYDQ